VVSGGKPYIEKQTNTETIRMFDVKLSDLYVWHRDENNRTITVKQGTGWRFQFDNELPFPIVPGDQIFIPHYHYHRLIPGDDNLIISIEEELDFQESIDSLLKNI